jgi:sialic acid synthase SpsE
VGLNVLEEMRLKYDLAVGLSDHTVTPFASFAAVTLGTEVIERHFTFSHKMYGSYAKHSLERKRSPEQLKRQHNPDV